MKNLSNLNIDLSSNNISEFSELAVISNLSKLTGLGLDLSFNQLSDLSDLSFLE